MSKATQKDAELLIELVKMVNTPEMNEAQNWIWSDEFATNKDKFSEKFPPGSEGNRKTSSVFAFYEMVGTLYKHKLINKELLYDMFSIRGLWERVSSVCRGDREKYNVPQLWENFELLAKDEPVRRTIKSKPKKKK
jgi:hypothetical protein